jgi:hypothetical protein
MSTMTAAGAAPAEALELTWRIREAADAVYQLVREAHEQHVWATLGYDSWAEYARAELGLGRPDEFPA